MSGTSSSSLIAIMAVALVATQTTGFSVPQAPTSRRLTQLRMGLFDGVKEAFSAPALERSQIAADRETPIDRWMGWTVVSENTQAQQQQQQSGTSSKCTLIWLSANLMEGDTLNSIAT
jgi:hypothetical protein